MRRKMPISPKERLRRQRMAEKAEAEQALEGGSITEYNRHLTRLWIEGRITQENVLQRLLDYHRRGAEASDSTPDEDG